MASPVLYTRGRDRNSVANRVTDRLRQQINSVIIPTNDDEGVHLLMETDDHSTGTLTDSPYYRHLNLSHLFDIGDFCSNPGAILDAVIVDDEWFYFILEDSCLLRYCRVCSPTIARSEDVDDESPVTTVPLKLDNNQDFYPRHIRFDESTRAMYMSGFTYPEGSNSRVNLLAKFSLSGTVLNRSKPFPVIEKFGDFDLSSHASAAGLWIASTGTSKDRPDKCQIFKLSNDFHKKMNFVDLNIGRHRYVPNFVASDDFFVYVSVTKVSQESDDPESMSENVKEEGRILTFPSFQRDRDLDSKTQEWLHVNSWDFQILCPGKSVCISSNSLNFTIGCRLLVVDRVYGSLHLIIWRCSEPSGKPLCLPVRCTFGNDQKIPPARRVVLHKNQLFVIGDTQVFVGQVDGLTEDIDFVNFVPRDPRV